MRRILTGIGAGLFMLVASGVSAEDQLPDLTTPETAVRSLFKAMARGDGALVDQVFADDGQLRRITNEGALRADGLPRWREWVDAQEPGDAIEEIFALRVQEFGHLASVWAPFVVTYKGEIAGCGVNEFVLAKSDGDWRIVFGMDTAAAPEVDCASFKESYSPQ